MKYFYFILFLFVIYLSGFSQATLNSTGNITLSGDGLFMISSSGNQAESMVTSFNNTLPVKNSMLFNPNPATNNIRIGYSIAACSKVSLSVFNQIGQEVLLFVREYQKEGNYYLDADITKLLPGIYFIRLNAGKEIITKKLIVN